MVLTIKRSDASKVKELEQHKEEAITYVNSASEQVRKKYITPIVGQEMMYLMKEQEAKSFMTYYNDPDAVMPDLSEFPFINKEIGTTGQDAFEVAQVFLNLSALWRVVGSALEQIRVASNEAIRTATDKATIDLAVIDCIDALGDY